MPLEIITFHLDPMDNNTYLAADPQQGDAVIIDPGFNSQHVVQEAVRRGWQTRAIWLTHAHFDHIAGISDILETINTPLPVGLHPLDLPLWQQGGGAGLFGFQIKASPEPEFSFQHGQVLMIGSQAVEVRHTPGHTPGHVIFSAQGDQVVFCGDLIFYHGVGRTDLPGGSHSLLLRSIREQILSLPASTRLLSGHGIETTVAEEQAHNPFLAP